MLRYRFRQSLLITEERNMRMMFPYRTDLTAKQWETIQQWIKQGPQQICRRRIINAILYLVRTDDQWQNLLHHFPNWKTVYNVFWHWRNDGSGKRSTMPCAVWCGK